MVDDIVYAHAAQQDSLTLFQEYLATFPNAKHKEEALSNVERKHWELAKAKDTIEAYEEFEEKFPGTGFQSQLDAAVQRLNFVEAKISGDVEILLAHLERYPESAFAAEALAEIDRLRFIEARNINTIAAYQDFMRKHPETRYRDECEQAIQAIRTGEQFNLARRTNTRQAFENFLKRFPDSAYSPEARAMTAFFQAKSSRSLQDCEEFFRKYHAAQIRRLAEDEYAQILGVVVELGTEYKDRRDRGELDAGVAPLITLHGELWGRDSYTPDVVSLRQQLNESTVLWNVFDYAAGPSEQLYALQHFDQSDLREVIGIEVGSQSLQEKAETGLWGNDIDLVTAQPVMDLYFRPRATKAEYMLRAVYELQLQYTRQWKGAIGVALGLAGRDEEKWVTTYSATADLTLIPGQTTGPVEFKFSRFETYRDDYGIPLVIDSDTVGDIVKEELRFIEFQLAP